MKQYAEIFEDIKRTRRQITDTAKAEKELNRLTFIEAMKHATEAEKAEARNQYKAAEENYIKECQNNDRLKIIIEILNDNAKQAFAAECLPIICEIWNKYAGKPHGEKTADKIRKEIKEATGYHVYISERYDDYMITIQPIHGGTPAAFQRLEICPKWDGEKHPATDSNNKIIPIDPEKAKVYYCGDYVENPEAHAAALVEAHRKAKEAEKALEEAIKVYNDLTRGNIQHANSREGVKHWII